MAKKKHDDDSDDAPKKGEAREATSLVDDVGGAGDGSKKKAPFQEQDNVPRTEQTPTSRPPTKDGATDCESSSAMKSKV